MHGHFLMMDMVDILEEQERILEPLSELSALIRDKKQMQILTSARHMIPLMFTMLQNAAIREAQEKYDMATLLLYRLLEMIEQRRLAKYHLFVSKMDYLQLRPDREKHPEWSGLNSRELLGIIKRTLWGHKGQSVRQKRQRLSGRTGIASGWVHDIGGLGR